MHRVTAVIVRRDGDVDHIAIEQQLSALPRGSIVIDTVLTGIHRGDGWEIAYQATTERLCDSLGLSLVLVRGEPGEVIEEQLAALTGLQRAGCRTEIWALTTKDLAGTWTQALLNAAVKYGINTKVVDLTSHESIY